MKAGFWRWMVKLKDSVSALQEPRFILSALVMHVRVCVLSPFHHIWLWDLMDCSHQAPPSMGFSRQEYWSGLPCPLLSDTYKSVKQQSDVVRVCIFKKTDFPCLERTELSFQARYERIWWLDIPNKGKIRLISKWIGISGNIFIFLLLISHEYVFGVCI